MPRPLKCRRVAFLPGVTLFKPAGVPLRDLQETRLSVEEAEALRLKDLEGMEQEPASEKMNISRPTFQRILAGARRKVADAILNGKAIRISGGNFEVEPGDYRCCRDIGRGLDSGTSAAETELCPTCHRPGVNRAPEKNQKQP